MGVAVAIDDIGLFLSKILSSTFIIEGRCTRAMKKKLIYTWLKTKASMVKKVNLEWEKENSKIFEKSKMLWGRLKKSWNNKVKGKVIELLIALIDLDFNCIGKFFFFFLTLETFN